MQISSTPAACRRSPNAARRRSRTCRSPRHWDSRGPARRWTSTSCPRGLRALVRLASTAPTTTIWAVLSDVFPEGTKTGRLIDRLPRCHPKPLAEASPHRRRRAASSSPRRSRAPRGAGLAHVSPRAVADRQPVPCRATASACIWSANRRRHSPRCQASIRSRSAASSRRDSSFPSRRSSPRANPALDYRVRIRAPLSPHHAQRDDPHGEVGTVARLPRGTAAAPRSGCPPGAGRASASPRSSVSRTAAGLPTPRGTRKWTSRSQMAPMEAEQEQSAGPKKRAGIAGLTAAYRLTNAGWNVRVLEAEDHPGGRVETIASHGYTCGHRRYCGALSDLHGAGRGTRLQFRSTRRPMSASCATAASGCSSSTSSYGPAAGPTSSPHGRSFA